MLDSTLSPFAYTTGGTLAPDAPSYVERQADLSLLSNLQAGETCYVLNSRQMGKSSLCVRTIGRFKEAGVRTAFCDLTKFGGRNLTAEQWYAALVSEIGRELNLRSEFLGYWKENAGLPPVQRLFGAITELGLSADSPVVVFFDEIDVTLSLPFSADEFFAAIRQCYVGRATDEKLKRLSFCLLGTATPADLIQDTRVSPFNIGKRIELSDFTEQEAAPLASGLGETNLLNRVLHWTGGHPYLTQRLCQAVRDSDSKDVDRVCSDLFLTHAAKESDDNLAFVRNRLLKSEADLPALLDMYRKVRSAKPVPDDETNSLCAILKLSGVAKVEGGNLKVRNRIYGHVFDQGWAESHMPDAEKRRQKEAYRKGVRRTVLVAASLTLVFLALAVSAILSSAQAQSKSKLALASEKRAQLARESAERLLYFTDMQLAGHEIEQSHVARVAELVSETSHSPYRGFEWFYLQQKCRPSALILSGHSSPVTSVAYSNDGRRVATGSEDRTARIWDVKSGQLIATFKGHTDRVSSVAFSPDGKYLVTASWDKTARIWDTRTGQQIAELIGHSDWITSVVFSPDGTKLATGAWDKTVRVWDSRSTRLIAKLSGHSAHVTSIAFSKDARFIASGSQDTTAKVWSTATWLPVRTFTGHSREIFSVALSSDGTRLATGSSDNTCKVWSTTTGELIRTLSGHEERVTAVAFAPNGDWIATGSRDNTARIWSLRTGATNKILTGHSNDVANIAFSPDGEYLATSSSDATAIIWELALGKKVPVFRGYKDNTWTAISPNGGQLAVVSANGLAQIWTPATDKRISIHAHSDMVHSVVFAKDGGRIATCSRDGNARVWDSNTGSLLATLRGHTKAIYDVAFSPDGKLLATVSEDKSARIWNVGTQSSMMVLSKHNEGVLSTAFSQDGNLLATGSHDRTVRVWDVKSGTCERVLRGHSGDVMVVAFSPDGTHLVSGSSDKTAIVWDLGTGKSTVTLKGPADQVYGACYSPDGSRIATSSDDGIVRLWDPVSGNCAVSLPVRGPGAIHFSSDALKLFSAAETSEGLTIKVWNAGSAAKSQLWQEGRETGGVK